MSVMRGFALPLMLLMLASVAAPAPARAATLTEAQLDASVRAMRGYLWSQQQSDGGWDNRLHPRGGLSSLIVLALLSSGESSQGPAMTRAIDFIRLREPDGTYSYATRAQALSYLPDAYLPHLRRDAQWLVNACAPQGQWGYGAVGETLNHSTTHFAVLGLWEALRRDVLMSKSPWSRASMHFQRHQNPDGGWGYMPMRESTGSMTAAGLSVLLGAQQALGRESVSADPALQAGIDRGIAWLDQRFIGGENPPNGGWDLYYLFALERVALAGGVRYFRKQDWFIEGAQYIRARQADAATGDGASVNNSVVDTAFALIFLSRGRVPVWISKLRLPDQPTHRRPNDIFFLNQYLGRLREKDMNWQLLGPDDPIEGFLAAPVLYLSGRSAIQLNEFQKATLHNYLLRGGCLLANPDEGSEVFSASIRALAAELFPQWPMQPLPQEHPLFETLHHLEADHLPPVHAVHNGARDLVLLLDRDLGYVWQADKDPGQTPSWKVGANLWALLTDRGSLPTRLERQPVTRQPGVATATLKVGRVAFDGNWLPEPAALQVLSDDLFNRHDFELQIQDIDLRAMRDLSQAPPLLVLTGAGDDLPSDEIFARLALYVQQGGTLLVETVGGRGRFARQVEQRLGRLLNTAGVELGASHPILSGATLDGHDATRVGYRHYALTQMSLRTWPRLAAIFLDDRPAVIISSEDLSLGVLDVPRYGVIGYATPSARAIMTNLMLWMRQQPQSGAGAAETTSRPALPQVPHHAVDPLRRTR